MRAGLGFNLCGSRETALLPGIDEIACEAAQSSSAASILLHAQSGLSIERVMTGPIRGDYGAYR